MATTTPLTIRVIILPIASLVLLHRPCLDLLALMRTNRHQVTVGAASEIWPPGSGKCSSL